MFRFDEIITPGETYFGTHLTSLRYLLCYRKPAVCRKQWWLNMFRLQFAQALHQQWDTEWRRGTHADFERLDGVVQQQYVAHHLCVRPVSLQLRRPDIVGSASRQAEARAHHAPTRVCTGPGHRKHTSQGSDHENMGNSNMGNSNMGNSNMGNSNMGNSNKKYGLINVRVWIYEIQ